MGTIGRAWPAASDFASRPRTLGFAIGALREERCPPIGTRMEAGDFSYGVAHLGVQYAHSEAAFGVAGGGWDVGSGRSGAGLSAGAGRVGICRRRWGPRL